MMAMQRQEDQDRGEEQRENERQRQEDDHELRLHKQRMVNTCYQTMQSMMMMVMTQGVNSYANPMAAAQRIN